MGAGGRPEIRGKRKVGSVEGGIGETNQAEGKQNGRRFVGLRGGRSEGKNLGGGRRKISGLKRRRARRVSVNLTQ